MDFEELTRHTTRELEKARDDIDLGIAKNRNALAFNVADPKAVLDLDSILIGIALDQARSLWKRVARVQGRAEISLPEAVVAVQHRVAGELYEAGPSPDAVPWQQFLAANRAAVVADWIDSTMKITEPWEKARIAEAERREQQERTGA